MIRFSISDFSRTSSKKLFGFAIGAIFVALSVPARAQQAKIPKIGWLSPRSSASATRLNEFRQELHKLGYIEGKNIIIESRYAEDKLERLPVLADELVALKVDVLFTRGTPETLALKKATNTIPIVFYTVTDPVGAGLVESLARPGETLPGLAALSRS